jgi:hypothetical protein
MPGAVLNSMARGLVPLVSRESSIDTEGFGILLEDCSVAGIRQAAMDFANMPAETCRRMAKEAFKTASTRYTLDSFTDNVERILTRILNSSELKQQPPEECFSRNSL